MQELREVIFAYEYPYGKVAFCDPEDKRVTRLLFAFASLEDRAAWLALGSGNPTSQHFREVGLVAGEVSSLEIEAAVHALRERLELLEARPQGPQVSPAQPEVDDGADGGRRAELRDRLEALENHTYTMDKEFVEWLDEVYEPYEIAGMTIMASTILKHCDEVAFRVFYNNWSDAEAREAKEELSRLDDDSEGEEEDVGDDEDTE